MTWSQFFHYTSHPPVYPLLCCLQAIFQMEVEFDAEFRVWFDPGKVLFCASLEIAAGVALSSWKVY